MLIGACCQASAIIARAPDRIKQALHRFGHDVGMAFQLIDDALDYASDSEQLGKTALADLPEGKVTLPVILLRQKLSSSQLREVEEIISKHASDPNAVKKIQALVMEYDTIGMTLAKAQSFTQSAMESLYQLPATPARDMLENLAQKLLFRFH
jgi:octaprenyl-diphosphate synthase